MVSYENKILLAAEAAIFTSKFVLKLEENIILCAISLRTSEEQCEYLGKYRTGHNDTIYSPSSYCLIHDSCKF